jgi:hypothetical protein
VSSKQKQFRDEVAMSEFMFESAEGVKKRARLRVGRPYKARTGEWACPVQIRGVELRYPDIRGDTSLQALCLALSFLRSRIDDISAKGGKMRDLDDGTVWDRRARATTFGYVGGIRREDRITRR